MFIVFIPLSWMAHFEEASGDSTMKWSAKISFIRTSFFPPSPTRALNVILVCFAAILPLARLFHYGGEQLAIYLGKDIGDLAIVTLNKFVTIPNPNAIHID